MSSCTSWSPPYRLMRTAVLDLTKVFGEVFMKFPNAVDRAGNVVLYAPIQLATKSPSCVLRKVFDVVDRASDVEMCDGNSRPAGVVHACEAFKLIKDNACDGVETVEGGGELTHLLRQLEIVLPFIHKDLKTGVAALNALPWAVKNPHRFDSGLPDGFSLFDFLGLVQPQRTQHRDAGAQCGSYHGSNARFIREVENERAGAEANQYATHGAEPVPNVAPLDRNSHSAPFIHVRREV